MDCIDIPPFFSQVGTGRPPFKIQYTTGSADGKGPGGKGLTGAKKNDMFT